MRPPRAWRHARASATMTRMSTRHHRRDRHRPPVPAASASCACRARARARSPKPSAAARCSRDTRTTRASIDAAGAVIDDGIALYFAAPASFTGEDVVELQAHGSPVVLQRLVARCCALGARMARAGRIQRTRVPQRQARPGPGRSRRRPDRRRQRTAPRAPRVARWTASSRDASMRSPPQLLAMRVQVEAAIDFADEPLDTLGDAAVARAPGRAARDDGATARRGATRTEAARRPARGDRRPAERRQEFAVERAGRQRARDRHRHRRHHARPVARSGAHRRRRTHAGRYRRTARRRRCDRTRRHAPRTRRTAPRADLAMVVLDARDPDAGRAAVADAIADVPQRLWMHNKSRPAGRIARSRTPTARRCRRIPAQGLARCTRNCARSPRAAGARIQEPSPRARATSRHCGARRRELDAAAGAAGPPRRWTSPPKGCAAPTTHWARSPDASSRMRYWVTFFRRFCIGK